MPMSTLHIAELEIPADVFTLELFRAWAAGLEDPAPLVSSCSGTVYVEMSASHRSHGPLVTEVTSVLASLEGWVESPVWKRGFRLRRITNPAGLTEFRLDAS